MYGNGAFRVKMILLCLRFLFTFTIHRKVTMSDERRCPRYGGSWRRSYRWYSGAGWARGPRNWDRVRTSQRGQGGAPEAFADLFGIMKEVLRYDFNLNSEIE